MSRTGPELRGMETAHDTAVTVNRKRVKTHEELRSLRDLDVSTVADTTTRTNEPEDSVDCSSHVKRLPAKSDRNSGVVRIIEKSQRKCVQKTANIEEALQLDVGVGTGQW